MSLFSKYILPKLESEIVSLEPEIAAFILKQLKVVAHEVISWVEQKTNIDLDGDGLIGEDKSEEN